jgi:UDP-2,3-diacylglucosamine pyrophosphatase LpxH
MENCGQNWSFSIRKCEFYMLMKWCEFLLEFWFTQSKVLGVAMIIHHHHHHPNQTHMFGAFFHYLNLAIHDSKTPAILKQMLM